MTARLVVDASVVLAFVLGDEGLFARAKPVLSALQAARLLVPAIWPVEVANALLVKERQQRLDGVAVARCLQWLQDLDGEVDAATATAVFARVWPLARRHQLSAYDATYLELAQRAAAPLATFDEALRRAATAAGVALFEPVG